VRERMLDSERHDNNTRNMIRFVVITYSTRSVHNNYIKLSTIDSVYSPQSSFIYARFYDAKFYISRYRFRIPFAR